MYIREFKKEDAMGVSVLIDGALKECMAVTADGEPDDQRMEGKQIYSFAEPVLIFNEAGNVIYEIEPSLLK